jgi:hypothetical protein
MSRISALYASDLTRLGACENYMVSPQVMLSSPLRFPEDTILQG